MPIIPLLQGRAYGPEDIKVMSTAFDGALNALGLMDRADPLNELVAKKIIEIAKTGERRPSRLRRLRLLVTVICTARRSPGAASARPFSTVSVHRAIARLIENRGAVTFVIRFTCTTIRYSALTQRGRGTDLLVERVALPSSGL